LFSELTIDETPLVFDDYVKKYFNMTVAVKTKSYEEKTGALKVRYSNITKVRSCGEKDFAEVELEENFKNR
jgi:hypothetical protein